MIQSGRYRIVPTLAGALSQAGFATGAFVGAFPLDRRFEYRKPSKLLPPDA